MAIRYLDNDPPRTDDPLLTRFVRRPAEGFGGNDQLQADAVQIFKSKGVTRLKTV
jgi:hypothetical protein